MKEKKFDTIENCLIEVIYSMNQLRNSKVASGWFRNTYEIIEELEKQLEFIQNESK